MARIMTTVARRVGTSLYTEMMRTIAEQFYPKTIATTYALLEFLFHGYRFATNRTERHPAISANPARPQLCTPDATHDLFLLPQFPICVHAPCNLQRQEHAL